MKRALFIRPAYNAKSVLNLPEGGILGRGGGRLSACFCSRFKSEKQLAPRPMGKLPVASAALPSGLIACFVICVRGGELNSFSAKGISIAEYSPNQATLIAVVRADRLFVDHERLGFFKIGLLPMLVGENVQIHIASANCLSNGLWFTRTWDFHTADTQSIELRDVKIAVLGRNDFTQLRAAIAHPGNGGTWNLASVSVLDSSNASLSLDRAELQVTGPEIGRLTWMRGGFSHQSYLFQTGNSSKP